MTTVELSTYLSLQSRMDDYRLQFVEIAKQLAMAADGAVSGTCKPEWLTSNGYGVDIDDFVKLWNTELEEPEIASAEELKKWQTYACTLGKLCRDLVQIAKSEKDWGRVVEFYNNAERFDKVTLDALRDTKDPS